MGIIKDIQAEVTGPDKINIPMMRADYYEVFNIFRIFFNVFLSIATCILGAIIAAPEKMSVIHYIFLLIMVISAVVSFLLHLRYYKKSTCK